MILAALLRQCVAYTTRQAVELLDIQAVRKAIDSAGHPALLLVDSISGLASVDYEHDLWGADVTVSGSQKGLMMPPGLGFNALSDRAIEAAKKGGSKRSYWDWQDMLTANARWLLSVYARNNVVLRPERSYCDVGGGGVRQCIFKASAAR